MKLENQVVSLEIAKQLKELGVKQESLFYYYPENEPFNGSLHYIDDVRLIEHCDCNTIGGCDRCGVAVSKMTDCYSAFTVAELGELLPSGIYSMRINYGLANGYKVFNDGLGSNYHSEFTETEAEARGKMLIYLLENNLLNLKEGER